MSYDNTTDTITVWGNNNASVYNITGNNESNAITFEEIYEFGQVARGVCAVTKPASGSYAIASRLELGNIYSPLNATFVKTTGESLSFSKQVQLNFNATLISGSLTAENSPFAGSTLSFSGLDANDSNEGQLYLIGGSELRLYDSGVSHTVSANNSDPFRLFWNGNVKAKSSTLQNWYTIRFAGANNSLEDVILTDMGEGFYPAATQVGTLDIIKSRSIDTGALVSDGNSNATITALDISEAADDILVIDYNGTANLLNPTLNFSNINWTTGSFSGTINRKYEYTPTVTGSTGSALLNATLVLLDIKGNVLFSLTTDSAGTISTQTLTRAIYDYTFKTGDDQGPHTLYIKKYGKYFVTAAKAFSAATVETLQLLTNGFITETNETITSALANIVYNPPTKVNYDNETNSSWALSGTLAHSPIDQCQYFVLFAKTTKLIEGASVNFTINYQTGAITFNQDMTGYKIRPVYFYGGNLSVTNGLTVSNAFTMGDLYDFMQYKTALNNLSSDLSTVDGIAYTFCINLALGNSTTGGSIKDPAKTIEFKAGYDVIQGAAGGLLDLSGIGGAGLVVRIELTQAQINPLQIQTIYVSLANSLGNPETGQTITSNIYYPNGTAWQESLAFTEFTDGIYRLSFTMPDSDIIPYGSYSIRITGSAFTAV